MRFFLKIIKVPPQIMTSYEIMANERPVYTVIDQMVKIYAGLSLVILSYDVIIWGATYGPKTLLLVTSLS